MSATDYKNAVLADSPKMYWPLDDDTGSTTFASLAGAWDLTVQDTVQFGATGLLPQESNLCTNFSGTGNGFADNSAYILTGDFTFELYAELPTTANGCTIFDMGAGGFISFHLTSVGNDVRFVVRAEDDGANSHDLLFSPIVGGLIYRIVLQNDTTNKKFRLQLNNSTWEEIAWGFTTPATPASNEFYLGVKHQKVADQYWPARLAHAAMYETLLTDAQLATHWRAGHIGYVDCQSELTPNSTVALIRACLSLHVDDVGAEQNLLLESVWNFKERTRLNETASFAQIWDYLAADTVSMADAWQVAFALLLSDTLNCADDEESTIKKAIAVAELLALRSDLADSYSFAWLAAEALTLADVHLLAQALDAAEVAHFADTAIAFARILHEAVAEVVASATISTTFVAILDAKDAIKVNAMGGWDFVFDLLLHDALVFIPAIPIGETVYSAWALNTETKGMTRFTNYPFTGFCELDGRYFGVAEDGLYELTGDTDDGELISAVIRSGITDLGSRHEKRLKQAWLAFSANGNLKLRVVDIYRGRTRELWYDIRKVYGGDEFERVVHLAQGRVAEYFSFELVNVAGADFEVNEFEIVPLILRERSGGAE